MNAQQLNDLPRPKLQRLASHHGVKANVKSTKIIELLLDKFPAGIPDLDQTSDASSRSSRRKPPSVVHPSKEPSRRSTRVRRPSPRAKSEQTSTSDDQSVAPFEDGPSGLDFGTPISHRSTPLETLRAAMPKPKHPSSCSSDSGDSTSSGLDALADASCSELYRFEALRRLAANMTSVEAESDDNKQTIMRFVKEIETARAGRAELEVLVAQASISQSRMPSSSSPPTIATLTPPPPTSPIKLTSPRSPTQHRGPSTFLLPSAASSSQNPNKRKRVQQVESEGISSDEDEDTRPPPLKRFKEWLVPEASLYTVLVEDTYLPEDSEIQRAVDPDYDAVSSDSETDSNPSETETDIEALTAETNAALAPPPPPKTRAHVVDLQGIVPQEPDQPTERCWIPMGSGAATWFAPVDIPIYNAAPQPLHFGSL